MRRGGDSGRVFLSRRRGSGISIAGGMSTTEWNAAIAVKCHGAFADVDWMAAFQVLAVGSSFRQQPLHVVMVPGAQWPLICMQQARSAGLRCAWGRAQAIVGATSGRRTARINANWRNIFMTTMY